MNKVQSELYALKELVVGRAETVYGLQDQVISLERKRWLWRTQLPIKMVGCPECRV